MTRLIIKRNKPVRDNRYWSTHTHSIFSYNDALPDVAELVSEAKRLGYPGLALQDHGNIAGTVQLYRECKKAGIKPFPGSEIYLVLDRADKKAKRYHVGLVAYTTMGYRNLVAISTLSNRNFHNKPILDLSDLASLYEQGKTEGIALTTGCYFSLVIQTLVTEGYDAAKQYVAMFAKWFVTMVELQSHAIDQEPMSEEEIAANLAQIATELGLKCIITQDSHYLTQDQKPIHESLKRLVAFGPDVDDAVFPGDGFHLADQEWMRAHHPNNFERGMEGLNWLIEHHDLVIPEMDHYDYRVPATVEDPMLYIKRRVTKAVLKKNLSAKYLDLITEEMEVIEFARMGGYLAMVADVCDHMREVRMFYQCRGSAAGSVVCWLLDITNVDPLVWNLRYDRFLSKDRTKPPDIDIDVEHARRQELIAWIGQRFAMVQIGLWRTYSIDGDEDAKGSLRVRYMSLKRKQLGHAADWADVTHEEREEMNVLSAMNLFSGYGVHPAGLIVCSTQAEIDAQVPLMWVANSKTLVSQYDGHDVESIGLVKLDVLGVKTLTVLRLAMVNMGRDPADGLDYIPLNDKGTYKLISSGDTEGIFQLEGNSAARGVRRQKPSKISDVIASMALFRPGVMKSGATDSYLARKLKEETTPKRHRIIEQHTKETFGILLYQDQVIEILRELGLRSDDLTEFLKAVKASNKNVTAAQVTMDKYAPIVAQMCEEAGMTHEDVKWLWEALDAFAQYSFNKSHATVYGITAYRCGYLAVNNPLEFHAALLSVSVEDAKKERKYVSATRGRGIRLLRPCVNGSKQSYAVDPKGHGIRRGLQSIKGIGVQVANEVVARQPYNSLDDFMERVNPRIVSGIKDYQKTGARTVGKVEALENSGAFESLTGA